MGDEAVLIDVAGGHRAAQDLARRLTADDVVPAATTVGVIGRQAAVAAPPLARGPVMHEVPVVLDGEDLVGLGLDRDAVADELAAVRLEVGWLGFMPGFAYLLGLPARLAELPRRPTPRARVPAGSFAVAGGYGGIYPAPSPGGWNLLGRTSVQLFDPGRPPYALLWPGDRVQLRPVTAIDAQLEPLRPRLTGLAIDVLDPGPLLLVEDLGRSGGGHLGVPRAGAANACYLRVANRAVGNPEGAAGLELLGAVRLRARRDLLVALAGDAILSVDGTALPSGLVVAVGCGQDIEIGHVRSGARAVLGIAGGIVAGRLFESESSDAVTDLPPGPLRTGDGLDVGPVTGRSRRRFELPGSGAPVVLRALAGPDEADAAGLLDGDWVVDERSDRTGVRLRRPGSAAVGPASPAGASPPAASPPAASPPAAVPSHAVVPGCIQWPPSGEPVVLGPDCGPVGGYPVVATVISSDLWRIGTLVPGDLIVVSLVSLDYAAIARRRLDDWVTEAASGWYPTTVA